jgi:Family of unknown function (DUF6459)
MSAPQALLSRSHRTDDEQPFLGADPSAIRLVVVPEIGPPFDDDPAARGSEDTKPSRQRAGAPGRAPAAPGHEATQTPAEADPDAEWARRFARLLAEALAGARPARQIMPYTSERARVQFRALTPLFGGGQRPRVLRVIATRPARDVIEMTVVAVLGARTRALAVRLERAEPAGRPAWLNQAARRKQPEPSALAAPAARRVRATATAPRWLCTDIEAA